MPSLRNVLEGLAVAAVADGANYFVTGEWLAIFTTALIAVVAPGTASGCRMARQRSRVEENALR